MSSACAKRCGRAAKLATFASTVLRVMRYDGESLVMEKDVASIEALEARKAAWRRAAEATPHGRPIVLADDPETPAR